MDILPQRLMAAPGHSRHRLRSTVPGRYASVACLYAALGLAPAAATARESLQRPTPSVQAIAAGPLDQALRSLLGKWDAQILYSPELVAGRRSAGLKHALPPRPALNPHLDLVANHYDIVRSGEIALLQGLMFDIYPQLMFRDENGVLTELHSKLANIGRTHIRGWQFELDYHRRSAALGALRARVFADAIEDLSRAQRHYRPDEQGAGVTAPRLRANAMLQWEKNDWSSVLNLRYRSSLKASQLAPNAYSPLSNSGKPTRVPSFFTVGVMLGSRRFDPWSASIGVDNLMDRTPANGDRNFSGQSIADDDSIGRRYAITLTRRF